MTSALAVDWFRETLLSAVMVGAPPILAAVVSGLLIGILQAVTQVNDPSVAFGPKALAVAMALIGASGWMLGRLVEFSRAALEAMAGISG